MSKVKLNNSPYTITSTVPEGESYTLFEDDRTHIGKSSYCTSGFWDDNDKGSDNSALGTGYDMIKLYSEQSSEQSLEDYIRIEAKFLADYVTAKNQYNLKVVKELLEGMLQEVNNRITWMSRIEEKLKNDK